MNEQLSLFENPYLSKEEFAQRLCDEFNKLETVWKGNFYVEKIVLSYWDHVELKDKALQIDIKAKDQGEDNFIYLKGDRKSQENLVCCGDKSEFISKLLKDKDFSFAPTPWRIFIFYHNWERKKIS